MYLFNIYAPIRGINTYNLTTRVYLSRCLINTDKLMN